MASNRGISILLLRFFSFGFFVASIIVLTTDSVRLGDAKSTFKDVHGHRYVLAVAVIGCAYTLVQIPFAAHYASKGKHLFRDDRVKWLFYFSELVLVLLLATGVGVGYGITVEEKVVAGGVFKELDKFLNMVLLSTSFLLMATVCMAVILLLHK